MVAIDAAYCRHLRFDSPLKLKSERTQLSLAVADKSCQARLKVTTVDTCSLHVFEQGVVQLRRIFISL